MSGTVGPRAAALILAAQLSLGCTTDRSAPTDVSAPPNAASHGANATVADPEAGLPILRVPYTTEPWAPGDSSSEARWKHAASTGPFVEMSKGGPSPIRASAKFLWDARHLYVRVEVADALLRAEHEAPDAPLREQDCVAIFVAPSEAKAGYFEVEVSPRGAVSDTRFDSRRQPQPDGHRGWRSRATVEVTTQGSLDDLERDVGDQVEIAIPWQGFSSGGGAAPSPGDRWRANVYVLDLGLQEQVAAAWSPPLAADFHVPSRFGTLVFLGQERRKESEVPSGEPRNAVRMPAERRPRSASGEPWQPQARETLIKRRGVGVRRSAEPDRSRLDPKAERLESSGGGQ